MSDFFAPIRQVKAVRKRHQCQHCLCPIEPGAPATVTRGRHDENFYNFHMHEVCRVASCDHDQEFNWCGGEGLWLWMLDDDDLDWLQPNHWMAVGYVKRARALARIRSEAA